MDLARVAAAMLTVGLMSSPVTALYCSGDSPAAKACCESGSACNQPGKTDDCCRVTSEAGNDQGFLPAAKADLKAKAPAGLLGALPAPPIASWNAGLAFGIVPSNGSSPPQASSPRSLVLRI